MDLGKISEKLKSMKAKRIMIQVPEGLKMKVQSFAQDLEDKGFEVFVSCEPCFGACDLMDTEAKELGCDVLLHIGHTDFGVKPKLPVIYEPYTFDADPLPALEKHGDEIKKYKKIGLVTTAQFLNTVEKVKTYLEQAGIKVLMHDQTRSGKQAQVLGCDYSAALPLQKNVDAFLYIGSGIFHPLGLALKTEKPVLALNIETFELQDMTERRDKLRKIKAFHIGQAQEADRFGILLTTKPGQMLLKQAENIKQALEDKGKKAYILVMNQVTPEKIMGVDVEILVNCSCPRMDEDFSLFKKPILNPEDINKI